MNGRRLLETRVYLRRGAYYRKYCIQALNIQGNKTFQGMLLGTTFQTSLRKRKAHVLLRDLKTSRRILRPELFFQSEVYLL